MGGQVDHDHSTVSDIPIVGSPAERLRKALKLIEDLTHQGFYGKLTVNYEGGKITYGRKEETIRF